jgi:soluble lytic murein transglycosylase
MTPAGRRFTLPAWVTACALSTTTAWLAWSPVVGAATGPVARWPVHSFWLVPDAQAAPTPKSPLALAVGELAAGKAALALPEFARATRDPELGGYALLYLGRAQLALNRPADAAFSARELLGTAPAGYLRDAALWLSADAAEGSTDWKTAVRSLQLLADTKSLHPERAYVRLGRAAAHANDPVRAIAAFEKVSREFALTPEADEALAELANLTPRAALPSPEGFKLAFDRAQLLFGARRYADAHKLFTPVRGLAAGDDRALIDLRLAECDYYLRHFVAARAELRAYVDTAKTRQLEAQYFYFSTLRELGQPDEYVALARAFVDGNADDPLVEEALNDLGTYYLRLNEDATAAAVFAELAQRFPRGAHADRAAWKAGWWAYRTRAFQDTVRIFESAAAMLPQADYRPSWLYWAARAHAKLGERDAAVAGYRRVLAGYQNSYYGREASHRLDEIAAADRPAPAASALPRLDASPPALGAGVPPPNAAIVRSLLTAGLYDDAVNEMRKVQLDAGDSPVLDATIAYALNRKGDLRSAITMMRHAYPEFLAEGGETLPREILAIIFPMAYWDVIQKYAAAHSLDPYLMAALIKQESGFDPIAISTANAWGLMQVLPDTGRRYAQSLGISPFRAARLTDPETNIRIGMAYFADLVKQFGAIVPALAAYNAGENRASRWLAERPGIDRDEFIDDLPFPETQSYIKRIIGSAEDYRRLYRDLKVAPVGRTADR